MKFITIDIGNSNQSFAVFKDSEIFVSKHDFVELPNFINHLQDQKEDYRIIVSSVNDQFLSQIPGKYTLARNFLSKESFIDMPFHYAKTLGDDRLVSIYFLYKSNASKKVLIDTGTFTTLDIISNEGFHGGYILPGFDLLKASYTHGKNLKKYPIPPEITTERENVPLNTQTAIEQGLAASYFFPIKGLIKQNKTTNVYLTGGNAEKIAKFLKSANEDFRLMISQELLHRSLCFIAKRKLV